MNESTKNVKLVTTADFDSELAQAITPVLVDFYAPWCGPCQKLAPRIDTLADQFAGKIKFLKVNIDQAQALAERFKITGVPTLMLFKAGKPIDTMVGLPPQAALKERLLALAGEKAPSS
jgi:thioredoxin 1